jgi:hypothetical protein
VTTEIQELYPYRVREHFEIVDHAPEWDVMKGMLPISDRPGLGIRLVEERVKPFLGARCKGPRCGCTSIATPDRYGNRWCATPPC